MIRPTLLLLACILGLTAPVSVQADDASLMEQRIVRTFGAGRYEQALRQVDEYLARWPETPHMHYNRACALTLLGRNDAAGGKWTGP